MTKCYLHVTQCGQAIQASCSTEIDPNELTIKDYILWQESGDAMYIVEIPSSQLGTARRFLELGRNPVTDITIKAKDMVFEAATKTFSFKRPLVRKLEVRLEDSIITNIKKWLFQGDSVESIVERLGVTREQVEKYM